MLGWIIEKIESAALSILKFGLIASPLCFLIGYILWKFLSPLYNVGWNNISETILEQAFKNTFFSWGFAFILIIVALYYFVFSQISSFWSEKN